MLLRIFSAGDEIEVAVAIDIDEAALAVILGGKIAVDEVVLEFEFARDSGRRCHDESDDRKFQIHELNLPYLHGGARDVPRVEGPQPLNYSICVIQRPSGVFMNRSRSSVVTDGPNRAPHRAFFKSMGLTDEDIHKPWVGVASTWNQA